MPTGHLYSKTNFRNTHHTSHRPKSLQLEPRLLEKLLEVGGRSFHAIDGRHQPEIPVIAVSKVVAVVGRQGIWRRCDLWTAECRVHDGVADEDFRFRFHGCFDGLEDLDAVSIRPVVSVG